MNSASRRARLSMLALGGLACVDLRPPVLEQAEAEAEAPAIAGEAFGVGWVVRDGVLDSYIDRVRIRPGPGWELLTDDVIGLRLPNAGVGLYHANDDITVTFTFTSTIAGASEDEYREIRIEELRTSQNLGVPEPAMAAQFGDGHTFELAAGLSERKEYLGGVRLVGEGALDIVAWYPRAGDRTRQRARVLDGIAAASVLSPVEVDALRADLAHRPDRQNAVGPSWSLRRQVYRDFANDFTWTPPGSGWNVHTGPIAAKHHPKFAIVAHNRDAGLVAFLAIEDDPRVHSLTLEQWQTGLDDLVREQGLEPVGALRRLPLAGTEALVQRVRKRNHGQRFLLDYVSIKHGSLAMSWIVGGAEELVLRDDSLLDAVVYGTRVGAGLVEIDELDGRVVDHRWGYALEVPRGSIREDARLDNDAEASAWTTDTGSVTLLAYDWSGLLPREVPSADFERGMTMMFPAFDFAEPEVETIELAGEPARHARWVDAGVQCDIVTLLRDRTLYQIMVMSQDPRMFERTAASFALLD